MQENTVQNSQEKLTTMKFFNFDLDVVNLKKILNLHAWFSISGIVLYIPMSFLLGQYRFLADASEIWFICLGGCCCYFFRYSPYMHGIFVIIDGYEFVDKINFLTKFNTDSYLIEKLKTTIFKEGIFNSIHEFFTRTIFTNAFNGISNFVIAVIFFYFAYSYQKLIKIHEKSNCKNDE
jgi:hypothetical protein